MQIKPKLGILIPRLGISDRGAEVFVYELAKNLCSNFEISLWVRKSDGLSKLILDLEKLGIEIKKVKSITEENWLIKSFYNLKPLRLTLEKFHLTPMEIEMLVFSLICFPKLLIKRYDILFPANGIWGAIICRIVRAIYGTPFVFASLGGIEPLVAKQKPNLYITINPVIERWFKKHFPNLEVIYISTGVDLNKFKPVGRRVNIDLPRPIYITISALVPTKRVDLTIKAVGRLKKGSLLIIGDGPEKSELVHDAQKYLGNGRFIFHSVKYDKLDQYYRAADVFTHAAPWEVGWSMVHLEALATNLPVVSNKEENLKKLLKGRGITCDVTNISEYTKALNRVLTMKVDYSQDESVENFSWEKIAGQYKKYLYKLL